MSRAAEVGPGETEVGTDLLLPEALTNFVTFLL